MTSIFLLDSGLLVLGLIYALWVFYLAVMNLSRARKNGALTRTAFVLCLPVIAIGYLLDILIQLTIGTVLFLDIPRETTFSSRLSRYWEPGRTDWRARLAGWFKIHLLDPFDPDGKHIS